MNNSYVMSASLEAHYRSRALLVTAGFAGFIVLLMLFLKWKLPVFEKISQEPGIEVELNLPDEPEPQVLAGGGGGGGNPVQAPEPAGAAPPTPPAPGVQDDSKDIETDDEDKEAPPVVRPVNPKPVNKVVENTSTVKTTPKPVIIENPAPPRPKAVLGKTVSGSNTGGGVATTYDRSGGTGNGTGVGNGDGRDGGRGTGTGGGNGPGSGTGNGPRRISGSRVVINPKSMDAGENLKGKVFAEIRVSPDGIGTFVKANRGSVYTSGQAIDIIREWLRRHRFNKASDESIVVYEFNFSLGG